MPYESGGVVAGRQQSNRRGIWTKERLQTWVNAFLNDRQIFVLANRDPLIHERSPDGDIVARR